VDKLSEHLSNVKQDALWIYVVLRQANLRKVFSTMFATYFCGIEENMRILCKLQLAQTIIISLRFMQHVYFNTIFYIYISDDHF